MADQSFFVFHGGKAQGPLSKSEVSKKAKAGDYHWTDYLWVDGEWCMLAEFFRADFPAPTEPPPGVSVKERKLEPYEKDVFSGDVGISNEPIWFLYKDNTKFGPYRYLELVRLLQTNACSREDFVWKPGFQDWVRLRQAEEFQDKTLDRLVHMKNFGVEKVFVKRRFPRVPYESEVILHDEKKVVFGAAKSLSEGGAFVEVSRPTHVKGDRIKLHFTPGNLSMPFNCIAEVTQVSKGSPAGYNVKFIYLEEEDRKRIAQYADKVAQKQGG